jgi:hypothetical protein
MGCMKAIGKEEYKDILHPCVNVYCLCHKNDVNRIYAEEKGLWELKIK